MINQIIIPYINVFFFTNNTDYYIKECILS